MSHGHERKEKDCLNCGTIVQGRFCQSCGQENIETRETFWSMFTHFFNDITHFDGKFFTTLKDLLLKPGFLSKEYVKGRRASYLNPIRMYVFTSALFFLVFFSVNKASDIIDSPENDTELSPVRRQKELEKAERRLTRDSTNVMALRKKALLEDTSRPVTAKELDALDEVRVSMLTPSGPAFRSLKAYDSAQASMPEASRDGWFARFWNRKAVRMNEDIEKSGKRSVEKIIEVFLHNLPYLLFASLPFFALILKLIYIRRRNDFYYSDHGIFTIHHYVFSFILLLLTILFAQLKNWSGWSIWNFAITLAIIAWPVHLFLAMKRFYGQRKSKTFLKFLLLNFLGLISLVFLFILFAVLSVFQL